MDKIQVMLRKDLSIFYVMSWFRWRPLDFCK